jgi:chromosome segregation ATPase
MTEKKVTYEENVITPEEFQELEKSEGKKIKLKKSKEEPKASEARAEKASDVDLLILKTEKLEGKIEALEDLRTSVEERISGLNEEIGELRSSIMEKDKAIREVQTGFAKIRDLAENLEPERIESQLAKKDEEIEKNMAQIESLSVKIDAMRKDVKKNSGVIENIRDIENLIRMMKNLKEKLARVEEERKFTSRTAGKIETMFADLSDKLGEFQSYKDKIAFNEETMHEIMKSLDMLETRFDETSKKDDIKKLESRVDKKFEKMKTESEDRIYDLKKMLDELLTSLKHGGMKGMLEKVGKVNLERMFASRGDLEEIRTKLDLLRDTSMKTAREKQAEFGISRRIPKAPPRGARPGPVMGIQDRVDSILDQAEEAIKLGNHDLARNLYRQALSLYNQLNQAESYQEAVKLYEKIRHLYSRLRIYA